MWDGDGLGAFVVGSSVGVTDGDGVGGSVGVIVVGVRVRGANDTKLVGVGAKVGAVVTVVSVPGLVVELGYIEGFSVGTMVG